MNDYYGWDAIFVDGPMAEGNNDRHFIGALSDVLYYAPRPREPGQWMWVGERALPPDVPWPGQVKYVAIDEVPPATEGGTVRFRFESES